jgi:hypothetical protein
MQKINLRRKMCFPAELDITAPSLEYNPIINLICGGWSGLYIAKENRRSEINYRGRSFII